MRISYWSSDVCSSDLVHEIGNVRDGVVDQGGDGLLAVDRFGDRRGERENLYAESGFDGLDLVAEKPRQAFDVAHGQGRADADSLRDVVDAVTEQVEATHAQAPLFERYAERDPQLADIAGDGFGRAARLGKAAAKIGRASV